MGDGVRPQKTWQFRDLLVLEYEKTLHRSKNYFRTMNRFKNLNIPHVPLEDALDFLLNSELLPQAERQTIKYFTIFHKDRIISLHCDWAPSIFNLRDDIYQKIGWYPYVTGIFLSESKISQQTDEWLGDRHFNALEFPAFEIQQIRLQNVCLGNGTALMLHLNDFKILLDCCLDLNDPMNCELPKPPDIIFISHAHYDHFASLEPLLAQHSNVPLIMSHTTLDLTSYFRRKSSFLQKYLKANAYALTFNDLYFLNDDLTLQLLKAGHFPGAAMLYLTTSPHKLLYTGDLCLYDLQPLKGGGSGIQNLNGPLHSLILDGQFCNQEFPSQKLLLDRACEKANKALESGAPVLVLGDPGSWLLIFYLKFFYYLNQLNKKFRVYLDHHTIEIMKILRYREEDITPFLAQRILHFHDPFASIMREDLDTFDFSKHSPEEPPILLYNSNRYMDPPPTLLSTIFEDPNALTIITGPIRSEPLQRLWNTLTYNEESPKPVQCEIFGRYDNPRHPKFTLHADRGQIFEILRHLNPPDLYLFHNSLEYLSSYKNYFENRLSNRFKDTEVHPIDLHSSFILYDASYPAKPLTPEESFERFFPLIKTLELAQEDGLSEVGYSSLGQLLNSKFPYWKEKFGYNKLSTYINEAEDAGIISIRRDNAEQIVKLISS